MFGIEEMIGELLNGEKAGNAKEKHGLPPGYRFHPTDEELIAFYLASKLFKASNFHGVNIAEVDLNRCEPWELPEEAKMGEREWYFFSLRVRKYPTGLRTNRATMAGYWKATGKDRQIHSSSNGVKLGTKKTLVFYKGGAPRGLKTKWVMHEYRLHSDLASPNLCQDEWVLCRIIQKSGEKIKPKSFQVQQTCLQESSVPSLISLPPVPLLLHNNNNNNNNNYNNNNSNNNNAETTDPNNDTIRFQRHENGVESFLVDTPHFIFHSNNLDAHFSPPSIQGLDAHFHAQFNPPLSFAVDGGALVDVADYSGGRAESEDNWSGGC